MRSLAIIYLVLVAISLALPFLLADPLAGVWAVILTLPWSFAFSAIIDGTGSQFEGSLVIPMLFAGAMLNVWLIGRGARLFRRQGPKERAR